MVVLRYLQLRRTWPWSASSLVALPREQLFVHRGLWSWLDDAQMLLALNP